MYCTFDQNNSGGYFIRNEDVDMFVIIEADTLDEVKKKANLIFEDYSEYCECCGERWDTDVRPRDLTDEPMVYGEPAREFKSNFWNGNIIIYYKNGKREIIPIKREDK